VASGRLAAAPRVLVSGARSSRSLPRARSRDACRPAAAVLLPRQCMLYARQGHAGRLLTASSTWAGTAACGTQGRQGWQSKRLPKQQRRTHLSSERARRLPWPGAFALAGAGHLVEEMVKFSSFVFRVCVILVQGDESSACVGNPNSDRVRSSSAQLCP